MRLKSILLSACVLLAGGSAFAQRATVTTAGTKYPLLEEGTGTWCGYCPDGSQRLQQTVEPTYPNCIVVSFHNGDVMTLPGDAFNTAFITGFPGATIDRKVWTHGSTTSMNVNRGYWATDVGVQNSTPAKFDVKMVVTYDTVTRVATVKLTGKAIAAGASGQYRLNAYVVEDSVNAGTGTYRQHSYMYATSGSWFMNQCTSACGSSCTSCANLPDSIYSHMNVVRSVMATGGNIYGDVAFTSPAVGDSATVTYVDTLPTAWRAKFLKIVGVISHYDPSDPNNRNIENAARVNLPMIKPVEVAQVLPAEEFQVSAFPSPVQSVLNVAFEGSFGNDAQLHLMDISGRVIKTVDVNARTLQLDMQNLATGMYLLKYSDNMRSQTIKISKD